MTALAGEKTGVPDAVLGASTRVSGLRRSLACVVETIVTVLEALIAYAWLVRLASPVDLIAAHFAVVLGYFSVATWVAGSLSGAILFRSAMLFLVGPLMGVRLVTSAVAGGDGEKAEADRARAGVGPATVPTSTDLESAQADALYAQIMAGRRPRRDASNRRSLKQAIESGDLDAQQFAIAMISQRYEPEMFSALVSALQSATPAVRVQAAAVFAKLRERMSSEAKTILSTKGGLLTFSTVARGPGDPVSAARCSRLAASGFVDSDSGRKLRRLAELLAPGSGPSRDVALADRPAEHSLSAATRVAPCAAAAVTGKKPMRASGVRSPLLGGG